MAAVAPQHTNTASSRAYTRQTDTEVIAACLTGDEAAWDALIDRYQGLIYSLPLRMGLSETDAQDVFQTVCLLLLNHLGELRDTRRLAGWLALTTRRETWRLQRRNGAAVSADISDLDEWQRGASSVEADTLPTPEKWVAAAEDAHLVRRGLEQLADRCRHLLELLYGSDPPASYAEAATTLKIPLGSVGPQRARCLDRLEKILREVGF